MSCLDILFSSAIERNASENLRVNDLSGVRNVFLTSCCVIVEPPCLISASAHVRDECPDDPTRIDPVMIKEALIFGSENRVAKILRDVFEFQCVVLCAFCFRSAGEHLGLDLICVGIRTVMLDLLDTIAGEVDVCDLGFEAVCIRGCDL
jgi:hypothetical protein